MYHMIHVLHANFFILNLCNVLILTLCPKGKYNILTYLSIESLYNTIIKIRTKHCQCIKN